MLTDTITAPRRLNWSSGSYSGHQWVKGIAEKWKALRDLESGLSNTEVAEKYGVPRDILYHMVKSKEKYFSTLENSSSKRKKPRGSDFEKLDNAIFRWFVSKRAQTFLWMEFSSRKRPFCYMQNNSVIMTSRLPKGGCVDISVYRSKMGLRYSVLFS